MTFTVPESWFAGCDFTTDWSSRAFGDWVQHLGDLRSRPIDILEIGAWEGRGSLFFLNFFEKSKLTALDIFTLGNEGRFDANVLGKFANRTTKVKGRSTVELDCFALEGRTFDLIYLDGSHLRDDVMIDSILAWRLLKVGGHLIWDDYELVQAMPGHFTYVDQDPKPAIDVFTSWHGGEMDILHRGYQVITKKTAPHYHEQMPGEEEPRKSQASHQKAARRIVELEGRLADLEATLALERIKLAENEVELQDCQAELREVLIALGQAQNEIAALAGDLKFKDSDLAELRESLNSSRATSKRLIERLQNDLRAAVQKQGATAIAELLQRQKEESSKLLEHIEWLQCFHQATSDQPSWWAMLPRTWQRQRQHKRLQRSGIFDAQAYLDRNPDVAEAGMDPLDHYLRHGFREGRSR